MQGCQGYTKSWDTLATNSRRRMSVCFKVALLKNSFYHPIECGPEPINFITIPLRNEILRMQLERL